MITNLLFTALCLGCAYLITLEARASRRVQPVRISQHARARREDPARRD
jgi:hypothetical protein